MKTKQMSRIIQIIDIIQTLEKYPILLICLKQLIVNGIDTEEKLVSLLKDNPKITRITKINLQNYFKDIQNSTYNWTLNGIPNILL